MNYTPNRLSLRLLSLPTLTQGPTHPCMWPWALLVNKEAFCAQRKREKPAGEGFWKNQDRVQTDQA